MNELSQPLFQLHAPFIVLTAKSSIEVQASITYALNMTDGDSRKRSMRKLRAIVFAANKFILNKGNYVTHQGLVNMPIFQSYDKSSIFHE